MSGNPVDDIINEAEQLLQQTQEQCKAERQAVQDAIDNLKDARTLTGSDKAKIGWSAAAVVGVIALAVMFPIGVVTLGTMAIGISGAGIAASTTALDVTSRIRKAVTKLKDAMDRLKACRDKNNIPPDDDTNRVLQEHPEYAIPPIPPDFPLPH